MRRPTSVFFDTALDSSIDKVLCFSNKTKHLFFVCDPSVDEQHTIIQSAVEQVRNNVYLY